MQMRRIYKNLLLKYLRLVRIGFFGIDLNCTYFFKFVIKFSHNMFENLKFISVKPPKVLFPRPEILSLTK